MQVTSVKIAGFIGLSMLAHGLLLFIKEQPAPNTTVSAIGNPVLNVSLIEDKQATNEISPDNNGDFQVTHKPPEESLRQPIEATKNRSPLSTNLVSIHPATTEPGYGPQNITETAKQSLQENTAPKTQATLRSHSGSQDTGLEKQQNFLLGEIQHQLSRHLIYPERARRHGWEGSVMVGFDVDNKGYLHNIHLTQTSGYALLDSAALKAIKKVNVIPVNQWGNPFEPVALQLPIIYRLTNS